MLAVAGRDGQGALELATQPPYPNYVGPSLVVAAGRWALGGPLPTGGAQRPADEAGRGAL